MIRNNYPIQIKITKKKFHVQIRCTDPQDEVLDKIEPIFDFEDWLDDEMNLVDVAKIISRRVSEHRGSPYAVSQFKIKGFTFPVSDQEILKDFVRSSDGIVESLIIQAYCQFDGQQKGYQFHNVENETLAQLVPKNQAPELIKKMKPGALIQADCPKCDQRIIKKVKVYKKRSATFTLQKGITCPQCEHHVTDLLSPVFSECEYNYKGARENGKIIDNTKWKSVPPKKILYWKEGDYHLLDDWINLRIFVRMFEKSYCSACNFKIGGDDDDLIDRGVMGRCGHWYHPQCFKDISQNGTGHCTAEDCTQLLVEAQGH